MLLSITNICTILKMLDTRPLLGSELRRELGRSLTEVTVF